MTAFNFPTFRNPRVSEVFTFASRLQLRAPRAEAPALVERLTQMRAEGYDLSYLGAAELLMRQTLQAEKVTPYHVVDARSTVSLQNDTKVAEAVLRFKDATSPEGGECEKGDEFVALSAAMAKYASKLHGVPVSPVLCGKVEAQDGRHARVGLNLACGTKVQYVGDSKCLQNVYLRAVRNAVDLQVLRGLELNRAQRTSLERNLVERPKLAGVQVLGSYAA